MTEQAALVASGGLCAPTAPLYDPFDWEPWTHADRSPMPHSYRVRAWLFPRWDRAARGYAEARYRIGAAWDMLREGDPPEGHNDEDAPW